MTDRQYVDWWQQVFKCELTPFPIISHTPHVNDIVNILNVNDTSRPNGQIAYISALNKGQDLSYVYADRQLPYMTIYITGGLTDYLNCTDDVRGVSLPHPITLEPINGLSIFADDGYHLADILVLDDPTMEPSAYQTVLMYTMVSSGPLSYLAKYPPACHSHVLSTSSVKASFT